MGFFSNWNYNNPLLMSLNQKIYQIGERIGFLVLTKKNNIVKGIYSRTYTISNYYLLNAILWQNDIIVERGVP